MIVSGTGHRPPRLIGTWDPIKLHALDVALTDLAIEWMEPRLGQIEYIISGMAQGWDLALVRAALALEIPFVAAVPFEGQESKWPQEHQEAFRRMLERAMRVEIICPGPYANWKFLKRDEWMVDNSTRLLALYDGSPNGGTAHTYTYAEAKEMPISNLWSRFQRLTV